MAKRNDDSIERLRIPERKRKEDARTTAEHPLPESCNLQTLSFILWQQEQCGVLTHGADRSVKNRGKQCDPESV